MKEQAKKHRAVGRQLIKKVSLFDCYHFLKIVTFSLFNEGLNKAKRRQIMLFGKT